MNLESLEARRLFAATVTEGYPGFYEVVGTEEDDTINVSINMTEASINVDGVTYPSAGYVLVHSLGGNDRVTVNSVDGAGMIGASVVAGDGHDTVFLNVDGGIWGGQGNDEIYLLDSFRGEAYGEAGNDYMHISGFTTDAEIRGGDGHDFIDCSGNQWGVVVYGGAGNDTILGSDLADELYGEEGHDILEGGGGNDMFFALSGGGDDINGGEGDDIAYVDANHDGSVDVEQVYYVYE